jgi:hypothetical protein
MRFNPLHRTACVALALSSLLLAAPASADPASSWQGGAFVLENDWLGRGKVLEDRWYTNGAHFGWSYRRDAPLAAPFEWFRHVAESHLDVRSDTGPPTIAGFVGQNIYTPKDIQLATPQAHDRPYAGLLTFGFDAFAYRGNGHRALDLRVGVAGPAAGGGEIQSGFHRLIHSDLPNGWHLQVRPRPVLQASYMHTERYRDLPLLPEWAAIHWHGRVTGGTVRNVLATGLTIVAGERDRVFGAPDEGDFFALDFNERRNYFPSGWLQRVSVIAQAQVSGVASNYLIEGKTYGPQPQIELKRRTWMATLGASIRLNEGWRFEYRIKRRSAEFISPALAPTDRIHTYGEVRFVKDFDFSPGNESWQPPPREYRGRGAG